MRRHPTSNACSPQSQTLSPVEVVGHWLQNLTDPEVVNHVVAAEAKYVSLNTENDELKAGPAVAGTSEGPQAFLDNLGAIYTRWETQAFNARCGWRGRRTDRRGAWPSTTT
jgi:hypothetical protein